MTQGIRVDLKPHLEYLKSPEFDEDGGWALYSSELKDIAGEAAGELSEMSDQQNSVDRPAWHEELRFAKKQQWYIATSAVTLLAAIFAIARGTSLSDDEKVIATVLIVFVVGFGMAFLFNLQDHLMAVRTRLDPSDRGPWVRGSEVLWVLVGIIVLSAGLVVYFLRFSHALC